MSEATLQASPGAGKARFDERSATTGERFDRFRAATLLAAAIAAVCAVSLAQRALLLDGRWPALAEGVARDAIAALLWIPIGAAVLRLARCVPLRRANLRRAVPIHLAAAGAAALVLNLAWASIVAAAGLWPADDLSFGAIVARHTIGLFHANALVYALLLTWVGVRARPAPAAVPRAPAVVPATAPPAVRPPHASVAPSNGGAPPADGAHPPDVSAADDERPTNGAGPIRRFAVRRNERTVLIDAGAVDRFEAAGDYVRLHVGADSYLVHERMQALEARLDQRFVRVHRSAIVRLDRIREVRPRAAGDATLLLHDGTAVPLSRRRRAHVMGRLTP
jgi:hypothetical protein